MLVSRMLGYMLNTFVRVFVKSLLDYVAWADCSNLSFQKKLQ
ncbi:conserved hypothetical protein (plasmid) [Borreliella burgdorferi 94a]|nr:conserved hypothetical protein [Borreliella burgdorferi 94a]